MHQIVFGIVYVLSGLLLAIPYCLLAGWNADCFKIVVFVAPAFLFVWFMTATFTGIIELGVYRQTINFNWRAAFGKSNRRMQSVSPLIFWVWTFYSFLPVILHWSAVLLGKIGYETVGSLIDRYRYASPLYVFFVILMLFVLIVMVTSAWDMTKNILTRIVHR